MDGAHRTVQNSIESLQRRLTALGIDADASNPAEAELKVKAVQNKLRFVQLYDKSSRQPKELRLKRFLLYGDETPLYQPGTRLQTDRLSRNRSQVIHDYLNEIECEREKSSQANIPPTPTLESLPLFKALEESLKNDSRPYRECSIYVLAQCCSFQARVHPTDHLKALAFSLARAYIKSENDLFLFVKFTHSDDRESKLLQSLDNVDQPPRKKSKVGWGSGMKKVVTNWYNNQDPVVLARSIAHRRGLYCWRHADLIKLCHLKAKTPDSPLAAVIHYALFDYQKTEEKFGSIQGCEQVMQEFKKRKQEIEADATALVDLVLTHNLKVEEVESEKLSLPVWEALVKNMTASEVLTNLPQLWCLDTQGADDIWNAAAAVLEKEESGADVHPANVFVTKCNYLKALKCKNRIFDSPFWIKKRAAANPAPPREPSPILLQALGNLMEASTRAIQPNGVRVLVTLDLRSTAEPGEGGYQDFPTKCTYSHAISPLQASALIALCFSRHHKRFTLTVLADDAEDGMQIISVPKTATVESIIRSFEDIKVSKQPLMGAPMNWAKERKRVLDAFVVVTPFLKDWNLNSVPHASPYVALNMYKEEMKKPDARFACCGLGNMSVDIAQPPRTTYMMDFAGFDANTIHVLNAFVNGELTD